MTDPGLPPKPRTLNLLESLVQEEEEKDKGKGLPNVKIPTSGVESSPNSDSQDNFEPQLDRENSASTYKEFKMKEIEDTKGVKSNPNAGFKGKKISKRRSGSSERSKNKDKPIRPFSADYKEEQRNKILSQNHRPKTSKGPRTRKLTSSPRDNTGRRRSKSPRSTSSNSYSDDFEDNEHKKDNNYRKEKDDFFDTDSDDARKDSKSDYTHGTKNTEKESRSKNNNYNERHTSDSDSSDRDNKYGTGKKVNGHMSRKSRREEHIEKTVFKKKDGQQVTRSDSESSDAQRMVVVEDYSSFSSSSDDESKADVKKETSEVIKEKPKNKKLLRRKKVLKTNTLLIDPDKYLEAKVHQKYVELEELMSCSFIDQRRNVTRQQLYQMELLRDQYHTVSHGLPSSHVIIPRSLPGDVRTKGSRPQSGHRPLSASRLPEKRAQYLDSDQESYDRAYGTLRSVMDAEKARITHAIRTDVVAVRYPQSTNKKKKKKKTVEPKVTKKEDHSEEEDISEKPSTRSNTSSETTPRINGPAIDHHLKYSRNEQLKHWLKEKNKIYRQHIKEEKIKKREEREKLINDANEKIERALESQKKVKKWMHEKNKDLWKKHREEKKREEAEKADRKRMEVNLPGDSMKIRPQSAPAARRSDDVKIEEDKCKGEKTPAYVKDQIHLKREIEDENKQAKLAKQEPHPPQTKFIYKRPVAGKIKFKMQQDRVRSPHGEKSDGEQVEERKDKGIRMSYDDWLKKKRRDDSVKRREEERRKELAKSDPELDRLIPDLAKKRIENVLNSKKRVNTGIKEFDDRTNKPFGGSDFSGDDSGKERRPRSAYRLASEKSDGPALQVKQVRPQTAPSTRRKVPHPQKSVNSPRKAVIPQKADAIMSNSDKSNPFSLPFPPDLGVPKYVAERQRKIFADQMNQRLAEAEHEEKEKQDEADEGKYTLNDTNLEINEENGDVVKIEDTKQPDIAELMYSPKKREDSSESSSEDEKHKLKERESEKTDEKNIEKAESEQSYIDTKSVDKTETELKEDSIAEGTKMEKESVSEDKEASEFSVLQETKNHTYEEESYKDGDISEGKGLMKIRAYENLSDLGFGPPIITSYNKEGDESDSDNENVSMSNSGTNDESEKDLDTDKSRAVYEKEAESKDDQSHLVGILKDSKGHDDVLVPENIDDRTFTETKTKNGNKDEVIEDMASPREGASMRKRVSFNEEPTVYQSFESSSTDTITPEQPSELNAEEYGLDAQANIDYDDDFINGDDASWQGQEGQQDEGTLSFNIAGFELKPKIITNEEGAQENGEDGEHDNANTKNEEKKESQSTFITDPDKDSEA